MKLSSPTDKYCEPETYRRYSEILERELRRIAAREPSLLVRNAALNLLQAYSVGYPVGRTNLAYASAAGGVAVITCLLLTSQYWLLLAVGSVAIAFAPYFPPIPACMFGSYMLLAVGAGETTRKLRLRLDTRS